MGTTRDSAAFEVIGVSNGSQSVWQGLSRQLRFGTGACIGWVVLLAVLFVQPLTSLMIQADQNPLHSHIPFVPLIAGYLLFIRRRSLPATGRSSIAGAVLAAAIGALALAVDLREELSVND